MIASSRGVALLRGATGPTGLVAILALSTISSAVRVPAAIEATATVSGTKEALVFPCAHERDSRRRVRTEYRELVEELDRVAEAFVGEWIRFDAAPEAETAVERHRYSLYGFPVHPANLRAEKLKRAKTESDLGCAYEPETPDAREAAGLISTHWYKVPE